MTTFLWFVWQRKVCFGNLVYNCRQYKDPAYWICAKMLAWQITPKQAHYLLTQDLG